MSRQLAVSSAFSVFALSALALLAPGSTRLGGGMETGARGERPDGLLLATEIAAPALPAMPALIEAFAG